MALFKLLNRNRNPDQAEMSFIDHLEALRWHIVRSLIAVLVAAVFIFINIDWVFDRIILGPIQKDFVSYTALCRFSHWLGAGDALCMPTVNIKMLATSYTTQFMSSITIAFMGGFIFAFPYIFWEVWRFVKPALTSKELKSTKGAIFFVSFFFFTGAAFGYFILAPFTFSFLANYQLGTQAIIETTPTISDHIENLTNITVGTALAFQLPVVAYVLTRIGLLTPRFLRTYRKYAIVAILIVAAIITPSPDWMSQLLVCIPLMLLYELSIFISKRIYVAEQKKWQEWE
ncbi:MAG TPA: twin-arginine translocase subunit TatC [Chitinophagaceae bacterium]|nr:twin-arginine translocase subunit TatC [Chitinophagaceae bacterium]